MESGKNVTCLAEVYPVVDDGDGGVGISVYGVCSCTALSASTLLSRPQLVKQQLECSSQPLKIARGPAVGLLYLEPSTLSGDTVLRGQETRSTSSRCWRIL